jgi:hypothetical protein
MLSGAATDVTHCPLQNSSCLPLEPVENSNVILSLLHSYDSAVARGTSGTVVQQCLKHGRLIDD